MGIHPSIHTYIHTYIYIQHTCIHTHINKHTHGHTYIHTSIHTYIHTSIHTYIHTYTHTQRQTRQICNIYIYIYMIRSWVREYFWWTSNFHMHQKESRKKIGYLTNFICFFLIISKKTYFSHFRTPLADYETYFVGCCKHVCSVISILMGFSTYLEYIPIFMLCLIFKVCHSPLTRRVPVAHICAMEVLMVITI